MPLQPNISNFVMRSATESKALRTLINGNAPDLSALTTTAKGNLVAALNELQAAVVAAAESGGAVINDGATSASTAWSSQRISDAITTAINNLLNGAPAALDTLQELAAALGDDPDFAASIETQLGHRVRVDTNSQGLTSEQRANARTNIGAVAASDIGDTETNFVAIFEAALV